MRRKCSLVGGQVEGGPGGNSAHASHCTVGCEREIGGRSSLESERGQSETTVHCVTEESCVLLQCSGLKTSRPTSTLLLNCTITASAQANFHSALVSQQHFHCSLHLKRLFGAVCPLRNHFSIVAKTRGFNFNKGARGALEKTWPKLKK